jgi:hypothetical protein
MPFVKESQVVDPVELAAKSPKSANRGSFVMMKLSAHHEHLSCLNDVARSPFGYILPQERACIE